jgi:hypothetical protein
VGGYVVFVRLRLIDGLVKSKVRDSIYRKKVIVITAASGSARVVGTTIPIVTTLTINSTNSSKIFIKISIAMSIIVDPYCGTKHTLGCLIRVINFYL